MPPVTSPLPLLPTSSPPIPAAPPGPLGAEEILALTFTEKAADEMQARVDRLVPYGQAGTAIHTFHAFGDRLIRDHAFELGLPGEPRVLGRAEAVVLLGSRMEALGLRLFRPLADPTRFLGALVDLFGRARDEDVDPDAYRAHAEGLAGAANDEATVDAAARQLELAGAYAAYERLLVEACAIDHGGQLGLAVGLLGGAGATDPGGHLGPAWRLRRAHPAVREGLRARCRSLLVDE